jgi:leucyl/phenylalanyl-tRNA---protein transferase
MTLLQLPLLAPDPHAPFPDPAFALDEPDGLLAFGGDLQPARLLNAYRHGIFPWYSAGEPILWWSPNPRMVVSPGAIHLSRRFRRELRHSDWTLRADSAFDEVIDACAGIPRAGQPGTWITPAMQAAYRELHRLGHAHSVEVFDPKDRLIGGIYGVSIGRAFFGESMFRRASGASRVALGSLAAALSEWGFELLDGQVESEHLGTLGFAPVPRREFLQRCRAACAADFPEGNWRSRFGCRKSTDLA